MSETTFANFVIYYDHLRSNLDPERFQSKFFLRTSSYTIVKEQTYRSVIRSKLLTQSRVEVSNARYIAHSTLCGYHK